MRHETELRVQVQQPNDSEPQWYPLDIGNGNTLTLDYVSNLLSDVSKITSSRSFTVKLPRTRRNDTVLDLAVVPQHQSERPYRYLPCRVYVDGIDVSGEAYMYLVSAEAATYNSVIVTQVGDTSERCTPFTSRRCGLATTRTSTPTRPPTGWGD